jgi:hypothetical protein
MKLAKHSAATPNEARIIRQTGRDDNGSLKFSFCVQEITLHVHGDNAPAADLN